MAFDYQVFQNPQTALHRNGHRSAQELQDAQLLPVSSL